MAEVVIGGSGEVAVMETVEVEAMEMAEMV
jgi:hypothetical protein